MVSLQRLLFESGMARIVKPRESYAWRARDIYVRRAGCHALNYSWHPLKHYTNIKRRIRSQIGDSDADEGIRKKEQWATIVWIVITLEPTWSGRRGMRHILKKIRMARLAKKRLVPR